MGRYLVIWKASVSLRAFSSAATESRYGLELSPVTPSLDEDVVKITTIRIMMITIPPRRARARGLCS